MSTPRRTALTATLATTAALSIAGVSWGIGTTVGGESGATPLSTTAGPAALSDISDSTDTSQGVGRGPGRGHGRGGGGQQPGTTGMGGSGMGRGAGGGSGSGSGDHTDLPAAVPGATITADVAEQLTYLVEEEKLAGDVYALAESLYGDRIFLNIGRAEDHHADEVRVLLDRYGLNDPTTDAGPGQFTDPELQTLYDTLSDQVRSDRSAAVEAGILIERTDIADLEKLAASDLPDDVRAVVDNLLAGSERHLAAFQRQA